MKPFVLAAALLLCVSARAQMTPEAVMGITPELPSVTSLLNYYDQANRPYGNGVSDPDVISSFLDAWEAARRQIEDMRDKTLAPAARQDVMKSQVTSTGKSVRETTRMSEADARKLAQSSMNSRLSELGLSQADMARMQSGQMSEAEQKALADKVMAARTGGMTSKDVEAMQRMGSDQKRRDYMQESGLGASMTQKMEADKGKRAASQTQTRLVSEMLRLDQEAYRLQTEASGKKQAARSEGTALFKRKYEKTVADLQERIGQAAVAMEDATTEAAFKAAEERMRETQELLHKTLCAFYGEYIPIYRDAVAASLDICRARMLPVLKQKQAVQEQLYALTESAEYALSATVPFLASDLYFELAKDIVDFELEFDL